MNGKKVIKNIDQYQYKNLKHNKIIINGMIPKLDNAFSAIKCGVKEVIIGSSTQLNKSNAGTRITY